MPRSPRPSLADVAREAGVSPALASLALRGKPGPSEASRIAVRRAARDLGYRVNTAASLLAKTRPRLIGVALSLTQRFHLEAVEHVYRVAEEAGYSVLLSAVTASRSLDAAVEPLISGSCEGILVVGMHTVPQSLEGAEPDLPVVVLGHAPWTGEYDVVRTAGDIGMEAAVDRLVSLGHRHIVHVDGGDKSGAEERRVGYRTAMERHGLGDLVRIEEGGADEEDGLRAGTALFSGGREVTAVTCYNDSCAVGVVDAALRAGLSIPGDVSIIGYDNSPVARTKYIDLTTVAQDTPKLAELAVRRLLAVIDDPGRPREEIVLPPHLVERTSIGPAPKL